jgi:serine/threonine protein kinase
MCKSFVGTFLYMSPERIDHKDYKYSSDIWSLGLVIMEAATGVYPYPKHKTCIDQIQAVLESPPPTLSNQYFSTEFCDFLHQCLQREPHNRATADALLESPWLQRCGAISTLREPSAHTDIRHLTVFSNRSRQRGGQCPRLDSIAPITEYGRRTAMPRGRFAPIYGCSQWKEAITVSHHVRRVRGVSYSAAYPCSLIANRDVQKCTDLRYEYKHTIITVPWLVDFTKIHTLFTSLHDNLK